MDPLSNAADATADFIGDAGSAIGDAASDLGDAISFWD
jgi:hypothetical protein